jgi:adenylate cyclase
VQPLKKVESGLKRVALEDFSSRISLKRQDELGKLSDAFDEMVLGIIERKSLGKFVAAGLDERVTRFSSQATPQLEKKFAAVLCSDIRSFTTLSEKHEVREIVQMLNAHLTKISEKIIANSGFVEQFVGDAVLAVFFGESEKEAVANSVKAALDINRAHKELVKERVAQNKFSYQIGVGIDAGLLVSGEVQFDDKSEYVMLGQPRIKAEALEAMSKLGIFSRIICSPKVRSIVDFVEFVPVEDSCYWEIKTPEDKV